MGEVAYNLRFPGQYYQSESGLYYNYYRDYDPQTGRYVESDPVGLKYGVNTYAYVGSNPTYFSDMFGLCRVDVRFSRLGPGYYHAYLVTTEPNGSQTYFRGGPSANGPSGGVSGQLGSASSGAASGSVGGRSSGASNSSNGSSPGSGQGGPGQNNGPWGPIVTDTGAYLPGTIDYESGDVPHATILNDSNPCSCVNNNFAATLRSIQSAQIPYNPFSTNSNAAARDLIQNSGLPVPTPPVWAPGWSTALRH